MLRFLIDHRESPQPTTWAVELRELAGEVGQSIEIPESNVVAALAEGLLDFAVSDDEGFHQAALRAGIESERILNLADARVWLQTLVGRPLPPPATVEALPLSRLNAGDPLLNELCDGDPDLSERIDALAGTDAQAWICREQVKHYAGLAIGSPGGAGFDVDLFAIDRRASLRRTGELLLEAILRELHQCGYPRVRVAIPEGRILLAALMRDFGFGRSADGARCDGWTSLHKELGSPAAGPLDPFDYHWRHGPPAVDLTLAPILIAPISPAQHGRLFPAADAQLRLPLGVAAPAEAVAPPLRKAWLSGVRNLELPGGAAIFFYRTTDAKAITALGVVESTLKASEPDTLTSWLGPRTANTQREIAALARRRPLAIRFRHARMFQTPIPLSALVNAGVLRRAPNVITQVRSRSARRWLREWVEDGLEAANDRPALVVRRGRLRGARRFGA